MNLKRIGGMTLAATALASASVFGATAAQAGDTKHWTEHFSSYEACLTGVDVYANYLKSRGHKIETLTCSPDYAPTPKIHEKPTPTTGDVYYK